MKLLLATTNLHKIREFKEMFSSFPKIELFSLHQFPDYTPPEENGTTFLENARIKASDAAQKLSMWVLADDSGLCVPALNGAPGIYSRRYAGSDATDLDNCRKLLGRMEALQGLERAAYYVCAIAIARPEGEIAKVVEGICEGSILETPRGRNGFGYDPLFLKYDYEKTFAELDESIKNRISHRQKAFGKLAFFLETLKS